jgi:L-asparaginase
MTKRIHILATGGTIAGRADTRGGYVAGQIDVQTLLRSLPRRPDNIIVSYEQLANVGSQSITHEIWYQLANRINTISRNNQADGIVVTHGTDTMEETAYFLNLVTLGRIPVVLTGAMKPADAFSPDGPENLLSALCVACQTEATGLGVLVVMNCAIHSARYVQKTGFNQDHAFQSSPVGLVGMHSNLTTHFFIRQLALCHTANSAFTKAIQKGLFALSAENPLPEVSVLYVHAAMQEEMLRRWMTLPHQGVVVAGVGSGNISNLLEQLMADQAAQGTVVVRSSRLAFGHVMRNMEINDDEQGFLVAGNLNPAKARILLQLALALKTSHAQIQALYNTH